MKLVQVWAWLVLSSNARCTCGSVVVACYVRSRLYPLWMLTCTSRLVAGDKESCSPAACPAATAAEGAYRLHPWRRIFGSCPLTLVAGLPLVCDDGCAAFIRRLEQRRLAGCLVSWLPGCLAPWLLGSPIKLGCLPAWPNRPVLWLPTSYASSAVCPQARLSIRQAGQLCPEAHQSVCQLAGSACTYPPGFRRRELALDVRCACVLCRDRCACSLCRGHCAPHHQARGSWHQDRRSDPVEYSAPRYGAGLRREEAESRTPGDPLIAQRGAHGMNMSMALVICAARGRNPVDAHKPSRSR